MEAPAEGRIVMRKLDYYVTGNAAAVLTSIKSEHIAEMQYHDCFDPPIPGAPGVYNVLFVRLKSGFAYSDRVGSYERP